MNEFGFQEDDYRKQIDFALWRRIACHALPYWRQLIVLALSGLYLASIESVLPMLTGLLIDGAITEGLSARVYVLGGLYAGLASSIAVAVWVFIHMAGQTATGIARDLRNESFARLQELSFSYYDTRPVGWLMSRLTSDCSKVSSLIPWFMLDLVWGTALLSGIALMMLLLNWQLALIVLLVVPPLALVSAYFQRKLLLSSRQMRKTNSMMTASFNEAISGVRTTKALTREPQNLEEFQSLSSNMHTWSVRNALESAVYLPIVVILGSVGVGLALWYGGVLVHAEAGLTIGTLIAFMQYAGLFSMPIQELARRFTDLQSAQAAAERIQTLLDTEPEIQDSAEVREAIRKESTHQDIDEVSRDVSSRHSTFDGGDQMIRAIEFRNVGFWYKPDEPVLVDFNLRVEQGQTVALVGPTGGGKSTIVNIAARFYEPKTGELLINGVDYRQHSLHWLQSNLGIVLQTPTLFSGSVRENIRYGRLEASDEEVEAAALMVNAHDFICELNDGYETDIGEGGGKLSTGQRQLVALARAVLADPQIFIMDEATSSVDTETERLIQDAVDSVLRGRIAFVIAHRLSTIRAADMILVIDGGRIIEQGRHDELMRRRGRYYRLYTRQFADQQEAAAFGQQT